jgi:hypothetical protein
MCSSLPSFFGLQFWWMLSWTYSPWTIIRQHPMGSMESSRLCSLQGKSWSPHWTLKLSNQNWGVWGRHSNNARLRTWRWPCKRDLRSHQFRDPKWHCPPFKCLHLALYWSGILWIFCSHYLVFLLKNPCFIPSCQSHNHVWFTKNCTPEHTAALLHGHIVYFPNC